MAERDQFVFGADHRRHRVEVDAMIVGERDDVDPGAGELPGDDVAVMLERREQDPVAGGRLALPQLCATRLMPSVAPRTKTISSGAAAPMKRATRRREASNATVMSAER